MSAHTPGPWGLTRWTAPDDYGWSIKIGDAPHRLDVSAWSESSEADARLIAAAPELLAALEAVEAVLDGRQPIDVPGAVMIARAAVAKARGGR